MRTNLGHFLAVLIGLLVILATSSCSTVNTGGAEAAAKASFDEWATSQGLPYEILRTQTDLSEENQATVSMFVILDYPYSGSGEGPDDRIGKETSIEVNRVGDAWIAESVNKVDSPFETKAVASELASTPCVPATSPNPESFVCVSIENTGVFDWEWETLHWSGLDWGGSFSHEVQLPTQWTIHLVPPHKYGEFDSDLETLGLRVFHDNPAKGFWIIFPPREGG